jgi:putative DNA primase/helicase
MDYSQYLPVRINDDWMKAEGISTNGCTTKINLLGETLLRNIPFCKDKASNLYFYYNGAYHPNGNDKECDSFVATFYKRYLVQENSGGLWVPNTPTTISKWIISDSRCRLLWDRPPLHIVNVLNGRYDWENYMLSEHTPDYLSTVQIPVAYDPQAECPTWDRFLQEVLPINGGDEYLKQIMGICLTPFTGLQKCIVLVGEGSNGKSTFLKALTTLIGERNVSNIELAKLTNPLERFSRAGLVGKLLNIFGDMEKGNIEHTSRIKPLTGEDRIEIESKHKNSYFYTPYCKLVFSCKEPVTSDDISVGFKRRFINIPFVQSFTRKGGFSDTLNEQLASPGELSGILYKVLQTISRTIEEGLYMSPDVASVIDDWCLVPAEVKEWLESVVILDPTGLVPMEAFYTLYVSNSPSDGRCSHAKTIKYMRHVFPLVETRINGWYEGKKVKCYRGINLKDKQLLLKLFSDSLEDGGDENEQRIQ